MKDDPTITRIREARHRISEKCGHEPRKVVKYYLDLQKISRTIADRRARDRARRGGWQNAVCAIESRARSSLTVLLAALVGTIGITREYEVVV